MNNESFKTLKKASLASALGVFAFTYAGASEANDDVAENQLSENLIEESEELQTAEELQNVGNEAASEDILEAEPVTEQETSEEIVSFNATEKIIPEESVSEDTTEAEPVIEQETSEEIINFNTAEETISEQSLSATGEETYETEAIDELESSNEIDDEAVEEAPVINDNLTEGYNNHLTLIDSNTNETLSTVSFTGLTFDDRLTYLVEDINSEFNTEYYVLSEQLTSRTRNSSSINGYTVSSVNSYYNIYLENTSEVEYPFDNKPFIPSHTLYDESYTEYTLKDIVIINNNGAELYNNTLTGTHSIDEIIRNAMQNIDEELYYYDSVDVSSGFTTRFSNGGFYSGEFYDIQVLVNDRTIENDDNLPVEPAPEQPDTEEPIEEPTPEQPTPEEPIEEPTPEQPAPEEPAGEPVPEQPALEEPTEEQAPGQPDAEEPIEEQSPEQPAPEESEEEQESIEETASEQPDTENEEKITETQETEKNDTESVIPPAINPVLPEDEVIRGVSVPGSIGTITLPDGTELTVETDLEGNWIAEIPAEIQIEAGETLDVTFYDEESDTQSVSSVTVSAETIDKESSEEEELLPDTGETQANTGIFAAVAALLGGALLFMTGRRKASKK